MQPNFGMHLFFGVLFDLETLDAQNQTKDWPFSKQAASLDGWIKVLLTQSPLPSTSA